MQGWFGTEAELMHTMSKPAFVDQHHWTECYNEITKRRLVTWVTSFLSQSPLPSLHPKRLKPEDRRKEQACVLI